MARVPDYEGGSMSTIDVVQAERGHTLRPDGGRPEILHLLCAEPGMPLIPRPTGSVTLHHHGLDQERVEELTEQVLRVTRWGIEKSACEAGLDHETGVIGWAWYGRRGPDHARAAHAFLTEQAKPSWVVDINVESPFGPA